MTELSSRPDFRVSVLAIVLFQITALIVRAMLERSLIGDGFTEAVAKDISFLIVPPLLIVLMYPYLQRCKESLQTLFRRSGLTWRVVILAVVLGIVFRIFRWAAATILIWTGVQENEDPGALIGPLVGFACPPLPILLLSLLVMSLATPIVEEVVHRGFIFHALLRRGSVFAVLASSALFAALHHPDNYFITFLVGIYLAVQVWNFRTLYAPIITHATYNAAAILDWDCFQIIWNPPASDPLLQVLGAIAVPTAVSCLLFAALLVGRRAGVYALGAER